MPGHYESETQIRDVVTGFETCTTDKARFKHNEHLTVAVSYLMTLDAGEAVKRMRQSLITFLDHHGVSREKYNQTITEFWFEQVALRLAQAPRGDGLVNKCNYVIDSLQNARLIEEFYSNELLASARAKVEFVAPDLKHWSR